MDTTLVPLFLLMSVSMDGLRSYLSASLAKLHHIIYGITEKVALVLLLVLICVMAGLDVGE